jgi:hypothetical protein
MRKICDILSLISHLSSTHKLFIWSSSRIGWPLRYYFLLSSVCRQASIRTLSLWIHLWYALYYVIRISPLSPKKIAIFQNKLEANVDVNILRICSQDADTEKHQQKSTWVTVNTAKRQTYTATMILSWRPNS